MGVSKVAQIIRRRFDEGLPLNISAVKRDQPKLLVSCYSTDPPEGWYQTLVKAEIDPYAIEHELEEKVRCEVCKKWFVSVATHLKSHGMTPQEYKEEFGGELMSESNRPIRRECAILPHWERVYSKEYVIDRIMEWAKIAPVNATAMAENDEATFFKACEYFGQWELALEAAGIDAVRVKEEARYKVWSKEKLEKALRSAPQSQRLSTDLALAARRLYGSLSQALAQLGISRDEFGRGVKYLDSEVEEVVQKVKDTTVLRGRERVARLKQVYHTHKNMINSRYGGLVKMARVIGLEKEDVSWVFYRHERDVIHGLQSYPATLKKTNLAKLDKSLFRAIDERMSKSFAELLKMAHSRKE